MISKNKKIILAILVLGLFLFSFNFAFAQENGQECVMENEQCTDQGLQLATLLENRGLSFSLVVLAGLLDGVNPCAIGMLILLLGYLLVLLVRTKEVRTLQGLAASQIVVYSFRFAS